MRGDVWVFASLGGVCSLPQSPRYTWLITRSIRNTRNARKLHWSVNLAVRSHICQKFNLWVKVKPPLNPKQQVKCL